MKAFIILLMLPFFSNAQQLQPLSLSKAYELAQQNYPLVKQRDLISKTADINIDNLSKGFLPQLNVSGQASYQSDVTSVNIPIPGIKINPASKDQYKVVADVSQLLYDGGSIKQQKNIQQLNQAEEEQKVAVELYKIKERINQLFLGVLYLDEQMKQVELTASDLNNGIKKTAAQVNNGVAFRSNLNILKAELLKSDQRGIEIMSSRKGLIDVLGLFINQSLPKDQVLERPLVAALISDSGIARPELKLFSTQRNLLQGQGALIDSRIKPKANLFFQGGYGRPGLNFLDNDFAFFYVTGLRLNWNFGSLYTRKNDKQLISIGKQAVDVQQETFLLNSNASLKQQQSEIEKLQELISKDQEIISLRNAVMEAARAQLDNAVITANDYLREVNAADQARQSLIGHQIQLLQAQINYQTISGKQ